MRRTFFLTGLLLLSSFVLLAQSTITGKVTDGKTGLPVAGASVRVKSTQKGTTTNNEGAFKLLASANDVLEITIIGYKSQSVNVNGLSEIAVGLEQGSTELTEVVVTGSRGAPRVRTESPVPIDVIKVNSIGETTAKPDLMSQLNMAVPSFNYNKQSGGDGSDAIDFASLRGLGFDQTLVLVNGKRRHQSAFVNQVGTRGRGNSGTDLNAIPEAAIDRIEILRDGASAQYGSDAIAGVINIILKRDIKKLNINIGGSGFYDHKYNTLNNVDPSAYYTGTQFDGQAINIGMDYGLPIGKKGGFINIGANFFDQGKTFRAEPDSNVNTNPNALPIPDWRRAFGDGAVRSGGGMYNLEIPISESIKFYSFGGYNEKKSNVYAWTRRFHSSSKRFQFPTDTLGNLLFVPKVMRVGDYLGNTNGTTTLNSDLVYYNPQENVYIKDVSAALGFSGTTKSNWDWDISNNTGYNDFHYHGYKTFNASLPYPLNYTKTDFDDGGFNFLQNTTNLDLSKKFASIAQGLTFSFGGEFRYERYKIYAGEPDSYRYGGNYFHTDFGQLDDVVTPSASGSEGYPGYRPLDVVNAHRTNVGGYLDLSLDVTKDFLIEGAARFENYSDFGFVNTYKLAARYKVTHNFNVRGSVSTGFRAPSLQQINFSNVNTNVVSGVLNYYWQVPNYSQAARDAGIPLLKQETSTNFSAGFSWKPTKGLTITVDGYLVEMKNRVVATGFFDSSITAIKQYFYPPYSYNTLSGLSFFANAVNTTNKGVDIVADYSVNWGKNRFKILLAGNIQGITINKINVPATFAESPSNIANFFSDREQYFLKASAPRTKFSLNLEYGIKKFAIGTHITEFGDVKTLGFGETSAPSNAADQNFPYVLLDNNQTGNPVPEIFDFKPKVTTDLYASYRIHKNVLWTIGVDNIFNVHPDKAIVPGSVGANGNGSSSWGDSESGGAFDAVQMGFDGMRLFTRFVFNF
jgi:iron complex outermembrane receptor protein